MVPRVLDGAHRTAARAVTYVDSSRPSGLAERDLDLDAGTLPRGLQGTTLMMSNSLYFVVVRFGDVLGTHLYDRYGGFAVCVIAITIVYALILPALLLVPNEAVATADGQMRVM